MVMSKQLSKHSNPRDLSRVRRKKTIRQKVHGTPERPRLAVFRSSRHIYAQVIDDTEGRTLAAASTVMPELRPELEGKDKSERSKVVGMAIAKQCLALNIDRVVFDRGGFLYTGGRIKSLADAAREAGLQF
jgi:large subunit ribosomal protein L18